MKTPRQYSVSVIIVFSSCVAGCIPFDSWIPTTQTVEIQVTLTQSGKPVAGVAVSAAPTFYMESPNLVGLSQDAFIDAYLELFPGNASGTADDAGQASLVTEYWRSCSGIGPFQVCDPLRDWVTGESYLIRIETDGASEIHTLEITAGMTVQGEVFTFTVLSVGTPTSNTR